MVKSAALLLVSAVCFLAGCESTRLDQGEYARARFFLESFAGSGQASVVTLPVSRIQVPVESQAIVSEYDYLSVEAVDVDLGRCLAFTLKPAAAREFYQISVGDQGKRLVLVVEGQPLGVLLIGGPIADGRIFVFPELGDDRLMELARKLKETNIDIQRKLKR